MSDIMGFETNIIEVFDKFRDLTAREMTKAVKRAINKAASTLKANTLSELHATGINIGTNQKYSDTLDEGVRMRKAGGNYDEEIYSVVHIMGSRASGSGTFRLRFFEGGTKDRYQTKINGVELKKPRYIGNIKPYRFFQSANSTIESQLDAIYMEEIDKAVQKINNSK